MPTSPKEIISTLKTLKRRFPHKGAMEIGNPYQTLTGVILSARTRDEQVLKLLPDFFRSFPDPQSLAAASQKDIEARINTIGMYRQKAKHLKKMATYLVECFHGDVPRTMEELVSLAGVGRKTASVVLVACFGKPAIAVDTHVHRVTNRLGWVKTKTPAQTEEKLLDLIPTRWQKTVNRVFVKFGRSICLPGRPRCWMCPIRSACRYPSKQLHPPKDASRIRDHISQQEKTLESLRTSVHVS